MEGYIGVVSWIWRGILWWLVGDRMVYWGGKVKIEWYIGVVIGK